MFAAVLISALTVHAEAATISPIAEEQCITEKVIYYSDGSSLTISLWEYSPITQWNSAASASKSGSKSYTFKDSQGVSSWSIKLDASFTYNGTTAICKNSSVTVSVYNTSWTMLSKSAGKSGNTATGSCKMKFQSTPEKPKIYTKNLSISCSVDGILN